MVRKIQGKGKSASVNHLTKNNTHVTSKKDIENTLADNFSEKSSSENCSAKSKRKAMNRNWYNQKANPTHNTKAGKLRKIKDQQEKQKLKFTSDNTESYN